MLIAVTIFLVGSALCGAAQNMTELVIFRGLQGLGAGGLFPLGYLVYGAAVLELGRDAGIELAERWILTPLGVSAIAGLAGLWLALARRRA